MWTIWITIMHRLSNGYILFLRVSGYFHYDNNMTLFFLYNHLAQSLSVNADGCCFGFFWRKNHDTICPPKTVTLTFLWRCRFIFCQQLLEEGYSQWWWNSRKKFATCFLKETVAIFKIWQTIAIFYIKLHIFFFSNKKSFHSVIVLTDILGELVETFF